MLRRRSSSLGVTSPCRLGSTSSAIKTETRNTSWLNDFTVESTIGRGKFAVVKKCVEKSTGQHFAAKCIRKRRHNRDCCPDIFHEIAVLEMSTKHPYLINLHRVYETASEVVLILEYAAGGEIFDHCVGVKDTFSEATCRRLLLQILDGVTYLHDNDIVHLDLKPQNILLTKDGNEPDSDIKLVDFGLSKYITNGLEIREILGTPDYVAPEVLNYEPISTATDIWSLGVVSYVMLTGVSPFLGDTKQETLMNVTTAMLEFPTDLFESLSSACQDLMYKMMRREPIDRLTAKQSMEHPWLSGKSSPLAPIRFEVEGERDLQSDEDVFSKDETRLTNGDSGIESPSDATEAPSFPEISTKTTSPEASETPDVSSPDDTNAAKSSADITTTTTGVSSCVSESSNAIATSLDDSMASSQSLDSMASREEGAQSNLTENDVPQLPVESDVDYNGNFIVESTSDPNSNHQEVKLEECSLIVENDNGDSLNFLGVTKHRIKSAGSDCLEVVDTGVTGTNFANVVHQEPIPPIDDVTYKKSAVMNHGDPKGDADTPIRHVSCFPATCCPILPYASFAAYYSRNRTNSTENDKENFHEDTSLLHHQVTIKSQKDLEDDRAPTSSPILTRLTLSSCSNSPNSTAEVTSDARTTSSKKFNLTVRLPSGSFGKSFPKNGTSVDPAPRTTNAVQSMSTHIHADSTNGVQRTDPSLKRRKYDYCTSKESTATEIPVAD